MWLDRLRYVFCFSALLLCRIPVDAQDVYPRADSVAEYYRQMSDASALPRAESYWHLIERLKLEAWSPPETEALTECVVNEIDRMLESHQLLSLSDGVVKDQFYPFKILEKSEGRLREGIVWAAACHGVVMALQDREAYFFPPDEYTGIPNCSGVYSGPLHRPRYDTP